MNLVAHIDFHYDLMDDENGSAQKVIKGFVNNIALFEVMCLSVCKSGEIKNRNLGGIEFYSVPENKIKNRVFNKILNLKVFTYDGMVDILNKHRPCILHFHNRHELVDKLIKKLTYKPKIICHFHRAFDNPTIPVSSDLILGVSKALSEDIKKNSRTKKRVAFIYNPISYDLYNHSLSFIPQKQLTPHKPVKLLFAFGDTKRKGYEESMEAYSLLKKKNFNCELYICGNKKQMNFRDKDIKVLGFLDHATLYSLMTKADILLFPSHKEALGLTILEALYCGMFVIPSRIGGIAEIFGEHYEYYCELNNHESVAEQVLKVANLDNQGLSKYQDMSKNIIERFSQVALTKKLECIYQELLE